jgi:hypothetical protein
MSKTLRVSVGYPSQEQANKENCGWRNPQFLLMVWVQILVLLGSRRIQGLRWVKA